MNRDERAARGGGKPLELHEFHGTKAIYPSDGEDGAWIAVNEYGIALALLNWNNGISPSERNGKAQSRGQVIPALIGSRSLIELGMAFQASIATGMPPFRLVGIFPFDKQIREWRWDSVHLESQAHRWESQHWFSSSASDELAEKMRGAACRDAVSDSDAGSVRWLRRLHASHAGGAGPFSVCVHREGVKTLSYTEVVLKPATVGVRHSLGSPCSMVPDDFKQSQLAAVRR